ncbi:hypothetical protein PV325_009248 [Microctonus aethiopoides]|nr:hypothetical protein PV325_009248 [Microctonus aethiopoides]
MTTSEATKRMSRYSKAEEIDDTWKMDKSIEISITYLVSSGEGTGGKPRSRGKCLRAIYGEPEQQRTRKRTSRETE